MPSISIQDAFRSVSNHEELWETESTSTIGELDPSVDFENTSPLARNSTETSRGLNHLENTSDNDTDTESLWDTQSEIVYDLASIFYVNPNETDRSYTASLFEDAISYISSTLFAKKTSSDLQSESDTESVYVFDEFDMVGNGYEKVQLPLNLKQAVVDFSKKPKTFFKILTQQANPNRLRNLWEDLCYLVKALIHFKWPENFPSNRHSSTYAINLDQALARYAHVMINNHEIYAQKTSQAEDHRINNQRISIVSILNSVPLGKRAIVKNEKTGHMMNYIRLNDGKEYFLCSKTGRIYDFSENFRAFDKKYDIMNSRFYTYRITGNAPQIEFYNPLN